MFRFLWDAIAHQLLPLKQKRFSFFKTGGLNLDWSCLERNSTVISLKHWFLSSQEHLLLLFPHGKKIVNDTNYMTQITYQHLSHLSSVPGQQQLQLENKDIATWKEFREMIFFFSKWKYHVKFKSSESESVVMNELTRGIHDCYAIFLWWDCSDNAVKWNGIYPLPSVLTIARHNKVNKEEWQLSINSDLFSIIFIFILN